MKPLALLFLLLLAVPSFAASGDGTLDDPVLEARARALQKELRCLVCQSQSLDESDAPLAADLRRLIRERLAAGDTDGEVKAYLVARYGDFILLTPPVEPATWPLWFSPLLLLLAGGAAVWVVLRRAREGTGREAGR